MTNLRKLLSLCIMEEKGTPSVEYIASKMTPVDEDRLRLPRSFAHTVRNILEAEEKFAVNRHVECDKE